MPEFEDLTGPGGEAEATEKRAKGGVSRSQTANDTEKGSSPQTEGGAPASPPASSEEKVGARSSEVPFPKIKIKSLEDTYSPNDFEQMLTVYDSTLKDIREGEVVKGKIIAVTKDDVIVDVGFKSEGIIPISEFPEDGNIVVGDEVEVYLEAVEDQDGQLVLSKQKADFMRVWEEIREAHEKGELVTGKLVRRIKGGMVVDIQGVDAFLPGSQISLRQVPNFDEILGQTMDLKIIKVNRPRRNIVVSRRVVLEEERSKMRQKLLAEIEPGQERTGVVKNVTDFGVFIDLGGVDGLLHITDMSWGRVNHPSEVVSTGEEITIKILDFDKETGRISLGLKQLTPYPWDEVEEKYPIGKRVRGKIVSLTDYGAFVELEKGVEGLIHISEMSWTQHIKHPSKILNVGETVETVVLSVDKQNEKISLGLKQMEPDPWLTLEVKYPVGTRVMGKVRNLTAFGAFVEIEEGIDGLVHISDLSWTRRISHPSEVLKKGDTIEVVILGIDRENRRISLGHKQLREDPWPQFSRDYALGSETGGKVTALLEKGVTVELKGGLEGFVPLNQLGKPDITKPVEAFVEGEELPLRVIEFDRNSRRIILSVSAYYRTKERDELEAFVAKHPTRTIKVEDVVEKIPKFSPGPEETAPPSTREAPQSEVAEAPEEPPSPDESQKEEGESPPEEGAK
jgi:small subunit ribosomal protein S1